VIWRNVPLLPALLLLGLVASLVIAWLVDWFLERRVGRAPAAPPATKGVQVTTIAVVNNTTTLSDADVQLACQALQLQITDDFAPLWGRDATVVAVPRGGPDSVGAWVIYLQDDISVQGALGYHDVTSDEVPLAYVGVNTCKTNGVDWRTCLGHEALEMLGDPWIVLAAQVDSATVYAYEACDAVEQSQYTKMVGTTSVPVTNFVTPEWFNEKPTPGAKYDFLGKLSGPRVLLPGGSYIGVGVAGSGGISWSQKNADGSVTAGLDPDDARRNVPQMCNRPQVRAAR